MKSASSVIKTAHDYCDSSCIHIRSVLHTSAFFCFVCLSKEKLAICGGFNIVCNKCTKKNELNTLNLRFNYLVQCWINCFITNKMHCKDIELYAKNVCFKHRYTPEILRPAPSWSRHGAELGGLRVVPVIKISERGSSVAHDTCMYRDLSLKTLRLFCVYLCMCGMQKPEDLQI